MDSNIKISTCQLLSPSEWETATSFRQHYFFDKAGLADPYTWTFIHPEHLHFGIYDDKELVGYAHVQLWPKKRAALRIIVIKEKKRGLGLGRALLEEVENWLRKSEYQSLHIESNQEALPFYDSLGYTPMPFGDPSGDQTDTRDTAVGKHFR